MNYDKFITRLQALDTDKVLKVQNLGDSITVTGSPSYNTDRIRIQLQTLALRLSTPLDIIGDQSKKVNMVLHLPKTVHYDRDEKRKEFGNIIRNERERKSLSQETVAHMANVTRTNLSKMEQGRFSPGLDIMGRVLSALELEVEIKPRK